MLSVEAQGVVARIGRHPPEDLLVGLQGIGPWIDRGGGRVEPVVAAGAGAQHRELGGVEEEDLEAEQAGDVGRRDQVVDSGVEGEAAWSRSTLTMPTCESIGQVSAENSAIVHCGVACGLPMKPAGRWTVASLASSQLQALWLSLDVRGSRPSKLTSTSGWPPAWVFDGTAEKEVIGVSACAAAASQADAPARRRQRSHDASSRALRPRQLDREPHLATSALSRAWRRAVVACALRCACGAAMVPGAGARVAAAPRAAPVPFWSGGRRRRCRRRGTRRRPSQGGGGAGAGKPPPARAS